MDVIISGWDEAARAIKLYTNDLITLGVKESLLSEVAIYPNPTKDLIYINTKGNQLINKIEVFDFLGREIENIKVFKDNTLDMSCLSSGVYLLKLNSGNTSIIKRIIKE